MGLNMVLRLKEKQFEVVAFNRSEEPRKVAEEAGVKTVDSLEALVNTLEGPRTVWVMVPNTVVSDVIKEVAALLDEGDTIIDGGNTNYKETLANHEFLKEKGIHFLDAGVSGGPRGAREGACTMVGASKEDYDKYKDLFKAISSEEAYGHMGPNGAGHFVKMVHNGIEYGMMQAIAEGFAIMRASSFDLDLPEIARVYNRQSVIESRLVGWLGSGFEEYGVELEDVSGSIAHNGEGKWTAEAAKELNIPAPIIEGSFNFRIQSTDNPSYTGKVVSVLRNQFGGHKVDKKDE